jgi:cysteine-rich repeat protein
MDPYEVYCDQTTDGGGWLVFQRRTSSSDFYRTWSEYAAGFGSLSGNFWLGNERIHAFTSRFPSALRVDMTYNGQSSYAAYSSFSVASAANKYNMLVNGFSGTAGDSLSGHTGYSFSTWDNDNDASSVNCAATYAGAWWYSGCHTSNLNGLWGSTGYATGLTWLTLTGYYASVSSSAMKVRETINICGNGAIDSGEQCDDGAATSGDGCSSICLLELGDSSFSSVSLLLLGNGPHQSTTIVDSGPSSRSISVFGNAAISTTESKFGGSSLAFDGSGDYLTVPQSSAFVFGTGDHTIEAWIWWDGTYSATGRVIYATGGSGSLDQFGIWSGFGVIWGGVYSNTAANYPPVNQWSHVAATRQGTTIRIFINGVLTASGNQAAAIGRSNAAAVIGFRGDGWHPWKGYIDDLRVTKGVARYTTNFTPPTSQLPTF